MSSSEGEGGIGCMCMGSICISVWTCVDRRDSAVLEGNAHQAAAAKHTFRQLVGRLCLDDEREVDDQ